MPFRPRPLLLLAATPSIRAGPRCRPSTPLRCLYEHGHATAPRTVWPRGFHASAVRGEAAGRNHYERLKVRYDASPGDIKKSFYALSRKHHPDVNRDDPSAAQTFSQISESYNILSNPHRRTAYDRDVLHLHRGSAAAPQHGSYHSTNPAGGRTPSGLSRRRGTFRGPPPSFYRSGGWGAQSEKRRRAHDESTGGAEGRSAEGAGDYQGAQHPAHGGMGPGDDPFGHRDDVPHFDKASHMRTHQRQDERRWRRQKRAFGDDDIEFEPQMSLAVHFLIVAGILGATFLLPFAYLQIVRSNRRKKELH
ncbi:hypothetical protein S7711_06294 [Stachybotrys chartarum IBT 7711]|uniref:J domain-containing protein n=1 Tax=Stachybotrys chartarum (strain CBS 109288 / IBT 7711) TaxID=1280523 RepID=A0A084B839_STACB|nr:hypothetical protein S7711_06294 [Stachybotrys chartarum IBT 7711]